MRASRPVYLDSSALVKLVVAEAETASLAAYLGGEGWRFTSVIAGVEVPRAAARLRDSSVAERVAQVLGTCTSVRPDADIVSAAASLLPATLRTLDAIHLATAMTVGSELEAFVTYDRRLADAAAAAGLPIASPGPGAR